MKALLFAGMTASIAAAVYLLGVGVAWSELHRAWLPLWVACDAAAWSAVQLGIAILRLPQGCRGCMRLAKELGRANDALAITDGKRAP